MNAPNAPAPEGLLPVVRALSRNLFLLAGVFAGFVLASALVTRSMPREYESSATLSIQENTGWNPSLFNPAVESQQKNLVKNQVTVLESRTLTLNVVRLLAASGRVDSLLFFRPPPLPAWRAAASRLVPALVPPDTASLAPKEDDLVERFYANSRVSYGRDSDILYLKARAGTGPESALLVNAWVDAYKEYNRSDNRGEVIQVRNFLEIKLAEIEKTLAVSEEHLKQYQKRNNLVSLPDEINQLVAHLANFESQYNQTRTERQALDNRLAALRSQLDASKRAFLEDTTKLANSVLSTLQAQMAGLEAERVAYQAQLAGAGYRIDGDAKIRQMENRIKGLRDRITEETRRILKSDFPMSDALGYSERLLNEIFALQTDQKSLSAKSDALAAVVAEYSRKLEALPDKSLELARLERDVQMNTRIYTMLKEKYEEARIQESGQPRVIRVLDRATPPSAPIRPNVGLNTLLSVFFGLLVSLGTVLLKEMLSDTVRGPEDLETLGVRVLGEVPRAPQDRFRLSRFGRPNQTKTDRVRSIYPILLSQKKEDPALLEAFRRLRTSIVFISKRENRKTLLFTSPQPSDGKSSTVANLAITFAEKGVLTLLVDADLRKPVLDLLLLNVEVRTGLTDGLAASGSWTSVVRETSVKDLHVMAAGPPVTNAPEILGSQAMAALLKEARKQYGMVLLDTPPLLPVADALVLAPSVDGVVLVLREGRTTRSQVRKSLDAVRDMGGTLVGAVWVGGGGRSGNRYEGYYGA